MTTIDTEAVEKGFRDFAVCLDQLARKAAGVEQLEAQIAEFAKQHAAFQVTVLEHLKELSDIFLEFFDLHMKQHKELEPRFAAVCTLFNSLQNELNERLLAAAELIRRLECRVKDLEEGIKAMAGQTLNESSTESMDSNKATLQKRGRSRRPEAAAGV